MILITRDGKEFFVEEEHAAQIVAASNSGAKFVDVSKLGMGIAFISPGDIARIETGGVNPKVKTLPPPPPKEVTPEQRAKNVQYLADMKKDLINRGIIKEPTSAVQR